VNGENLVVVGTGIRAIGQLTVETIAWIKSADRVLYVVSDPVAEEAIRTLNPEGAESLLPYYDENKLRSETYREIVEVAMVYLRQGLRVCVAVYGHPGVLAVAPHEMIRRARAEGFTARMLPAISAEDCLFADLGVDQVGGCSSYEATDFLLNTRIIDPASHLILWQIGGLGDATYHKYDYNVRGLDQLARKLAAYYGPNHQVTLYEAAMFPGVEPLIRSGPIYHLPHGRPTPNSTMYVPPLSQAQPDLAIRQELGMSG
jgi:uncharacterized protein YabN with tetrapyrrole methylase and pyrophosphatase domain